MRKFLKVRMTTFLRKKRRLYRGHDLELIRSVFLVFLPRVENVDSAVQITRLGGSDGSGSDVLNVNKDGCAQEAVFDNLISKKLNEFSSEEETRPKVKDSLAKMVNSLLTTPMDSTKKTELMDKYLRPENCTLNYPREP